VLCCGKPFHFECLFKWDMKCDGDTSCPMCRSNLCDTMSPTTQMSRLRTFNTDWAKVRLGVLLLNSDSNEGLNLLMNSGADGLCQLAVYYQSHDEAKYSYFLKRAADAGSADACFTFSLTLTDPIAVLYYLNRAADKEHDEAWMYLNVLDNCGLRTLKDLKGHGSELLCWALNKLNKFDKDPLFFRKRVEKHGGRNNYRGWLLHRICSKIHAH